VSSLRSRWASLVERRFSTGGRIVILIGTLLGFESVLYSAVTPVLPHYAHELGVSKPAIGILTAAYPAGMVPGSLLGAWIATRTGVRRTVIVGLMLFTVSITAFGFATDIVTLDLLRFVQGAACGCVWAGGLAWVIAVAPRAQRGGILGSVLAAAIFGTLLGPVVGTLAIVIGTEVVFPAVGAVSLCLVAWTLRHPEPPPSETNNQTLWLVLVRDPRVWLILWVVVLEAATIGATSALLPLRLSTFGASGIAIGATFLVAALLSTLILPFVGRFVDRYGPGPPLRWGLLLTAALVALLPVPHSSLGLAALTVLALGGPLAANMTPITSVITELVERAGVALVLGTMMLNLGWAVGEMLGAPAAAKLAQATSDAIPLLALAALTVISLAAVARTRLTDIGPAVRADLSPAEPRDEHRPGSEHEGDASADRLRMADPIR
jgi:predicted MFS family arabinose efflux permease